MQTMPSASTGDEDVWVWWLWTLGWLQVVNPNVATDATLQNDAQLDNATINRVRRCYNVNWYRVGLFDVYPRWLVCKWFASCETTILLSYFCYVSVTDSRQKERRKETGVESRSIIGNGRRSSWLQLPVSIKSTINSFFCSLLRRFNDF